MVHEIARFDIRVAAINDGSVVLEVQEHNLVAQGASTVAGFERHTLAADDSLKLTVSTDRETVAALAMRELAAG